MAFCAFIVTVSTTVCVPLTVKLPVTVRLSPIVTSEVPCPIVIAVPDTPVPIDTDSLLSPVSIIRYASEPCFIVKAVAELSVTATFMSVSSALIESRAILPTLVIALSLNDVAPRDTVPVAVRLLEPTSMLPNPDDIAPLSNVPTVVAAVVTRLGIAVISSSK